MRKADPIVVISWWSNCLGLRCLRQLIDHTVDRQVFVVQVGKSETQKARFREHMPGGVVELPYPESRPAEHCRVLSHLVLEQLSAVPGLWVVDHDLFVEDAFDLWLRVVEDRLQNRDVCLCLPISTGPSITPPAFWISPSRWPPAIGSFDPIPFRETASARRPDLFRDQGSMAMPVKDTLVAARDELAAAGRVAFFPLAEDQTTKDGLPRFPSHTHLGGLSLFAGPPLPPEWRVWMQTTATRFADFFEACPEEWTAVEDATLIRRCREFQDLIDV